MGEARRFSYPPASVLMWQNELLPRKFGATQKGRGEVLSRGISLSVHGISAVFVDPNSLPTNPEVVFSHSIFVPVCYREHGLYLGREMFDIIAGQKRCQQRSCLMYWSRSVF